MHHTIVAVDVEGFGGRDNAHQRKVREGLHTALQEAFEHCGLAWSACHVADRGDGYRVLVPAAASSERLVECLPYELAGRLREHNATADRKARIRLRMAFHAGEVDRDKHGWNSPAVVHTYRLLDSELLRNELRGTRGILALIVSESFHRAAVLSNPAVDRHQYRLVTVHEKETHAEAWVSRPDDHRGVGTFTWPRLKLPGRSARAVGLVVLGLAGVLAGNVSAVPPDDGCGEPVQLNVSVSAEKERVVRRLAGDFERELRDRRGCADVSVQVTASGSAMEVVEAIGRAWTGPDDLRELGPEPHVLLPDSSWEYEAAVRALAENGNDDVVLDHRGSIAWSPLVLAVSRRAGGERSEAVRPGSWSNVLDYVGRGLPGQPEALFRPSPVTSGAGLVATVALYAAKLGKLDAETLAGAARDLHAVELAVTAGDESGALLCSLAPGEAVLVSEKAAGDFNVGDPPGGGCAPDRRLAVTYPALGTVYLDHPFVAVGWPDRPVNAARDRVVLAFREFLTSRHGEDELRRARLRDSDGEIDPFPGGPVGPPARQEVGEVDVWALLGAFERARRSARVQLLVDVSSAMAEPFPDVGGNRLRAAADAVHRALGSVGERDEVGLWVFADGVGGAVDHEVRVPLGRGAVPAARVALEDLRVTRRPAALYGAVRAAVAGLRAAGGDPAESSDAVVVVGDGEYVERGHAGLVEFLRGGRPVPVFLIAFGSAVCDSQRWREITEGTGGACHEVVDVVGVERALDSVAAVLWGGGT